METGAAPLLVYDGDCAACSAAATWIAARFAGPGQAVAWQHLGPDGLRRLGLSHGDVTRAAWWVDATGRTSAGHLAVAHAFLACGGRLSVVGRMLLVPPVRWLGAVVYPLVARRRHLLPGGSPGCRSDRRHL